MVELSSAVALVYGDKVGAEVRLVEHRDDYCTTIWLRYEDWDRLHQTISEIAQKYKKEEE